MRRLEITGLLPLALVAAFASACVTNDQILKSGKETQSPTTASPNTPDPSASIEGEIRAMRDADFRFLWIVRRKDGAAMTPDDKALIRSNTMEMNRRVLADDGKEVIIGSNVIPAKERVDAIYANFAVEDLSTEPMPSPLPTGERTPIAVPRGKK